MVKILHATDVHTDLKKYEAIVNHANNSKVDAVIISGDLTDKDSVAYPAICSELITASVKKYGSEALVKHIEETERIDLSAVLEDLGEDKSKKVLEEAHKAFRAYQVSEMKAIDEILKGCKKPIYAVTGNHDPIFTYQFMENVHFLDREGSAVIGGLKLAGTPSTYEMVPGILPVDYGHLRDYNVDGNVDSSPEYRRLNGQDIDVLVTHCGLVDRLQRDTMRGKKPDQIMYKIMKEKGVKVNLSGHFHEKLHGVHEGILQLNPGSDLFFEIDLKKGSKGTLAENVEIYQPVLAA